MVLATLSRIQRISHLRPQRKSCVEKGNPPSSLISSRLARTFQAPGQKRGAAGRRRVAPPPRCVDGKFAARKPGSGGWQQPVLRENRLAGGHDRPVHPVARVVSGRERRERGGSPLGHGLRWARAGAGPDEVPPATRGGC